MNPRKPQIPVPSEWQEQKRFIDWLDLVGIVRWPHMVVNGKFAAFHPANEGGRGEVAGRRQKQIGVRAGVPDVMIPKFMHMKIAITEEVYEQWKTYIPNASMEPKFTIDMFDKMHEVMEKDYRQEWFPFYCGLFLEFKRQRGGMVSAQQAAWHEKLRSLGYRVEVVRGCDEAIRVTEQYMEGRI